eukprot:1161602-Pelagomonas_calceolata.AAC.11
MCLAFSADKFPPTLDTLVRFQGSGALQLRLGGNLPNQLRREPYFQTTKPPFVTTHCTKG